MLDWWPWERKGKYGEPNVDTLAGPEGVERSMFEIRENWRLRDELGAAQQDEQMWMEACQKITVERNEALADVRRLSGLLAEEQDLRAEAEETLRIIRGEGALRSYPPQ